MAKSKSPVEVDGVQYKSRSEAAKVLVGAGLGLAETAEKVGMTYQTVYSVTKGAEKVKARRAIYRVLALGQTGKKTVGEIAKKAGVSTSKVVALLKKAGIAIVSKDSKKASKKVKVETPVVVDQTPVVEVPTSVQ